MTWSKKLSHSSIPWFGIGMSAIFVCSVALRFWGLGRFNTLVFDEVYYAKFANNYLTGTNFFNAHPPLSQYIIAIGMWIGSHLPIGQDSVNSLTGSLRSSWSYRWLNALTGSFIPLVVGALAYALNRRKSFALIAALFAATDGLFLVESRYALNNVYLVILGLLGQLFFLKALGQNQRRWLNLALSGIFFGASACIKWNGLWFLLGIYMIWVAAWVMQWMRFLLKRSRERSKKFLPPHIGFREDTEVSPLQDSEGVRTPLQNLTQLKLVQFVWNLAIIPVLTYSLLWIPHLQMNPQPGFWQAQYDILTFHEKIGDGPKVHPYCSRWFSWLLMWRPVAYFYQTARSPIEQVPVYPPLPAGAGKYVYDVHAIGNPFLWWLSTAAILWLLWRLAQRFDRRRRVEIFSHVLYWIALYLVLGWLANLLPWDESDSLHLSLPLHGSLSFFGLSTGLVGGSLATQ
jgi:dolichyl-phosphate-mannose--protein O-mannosyl transferase